MTISRASKFCLYVGVAAAGLALTQPWAVEAAPAKKPRVDAGSENVFNKAGAKYESLPGMKCSFRVSGTGIRTFSGSFNYAYFGKASLEWTSNRKRQRTVTNGDQFFQIIDGKFYTQTISPGMPGLITNLWSRVPGSAGRVLDPLFSGASPAAFLPNSMTFTRKSAGLEIWIRGFDPGKGSGPTTTLDMYFGGRDYLLHRVVDTTTTGSQRQVITTTFSGLQTNPQFPGTYFNFKPGKKYKPLPKETSLSRPKTPVFKIGDKPLPIFGKDLNGKMRSLDDYKGKVLLVDFWATWCGPCVAELPNVQDAYKRYHSRGFEVLAVSLDEDRQQLAEFVKARKIPWAQLYSGKGWEDPNARRYGVQGIPYMLLIGPDGKIAAFEPRGPELEKALSKYMKGWV